MNSNISKLQSKANSRTNHHIGDRKGSKKEKELDYLPRHVIDLRNDEDRDDRAS